MSEERPEYCNCLYYSSNALSRIMTKMADEEFASTGLSSSYAFLLMTISHQEGIQPSEVACRMKLTHSTVTRLIDKMEYRGLLRREKKGKTTEIFLTPEGDAMLPKIEKSWANLYNRYSSVLGAEKGKELTNLIHQATEDLKL